MTILMFLTGEYWNEEYARRLGCSEVYRYSIYRLLEEESRTV